MRWTTAFARGSIGLSVNNIESSPVSRNAFIETNVTATFKVQVKRSTTTTLGIVWDEQFASALSNPDLSSVFYAIKLP